MGVSKNPKATMMRVVAPDAARDAARLAADEPLRRLVALKGQREARFQVVIRQSVLDEIRRHGRSRTDVEVCGVLVGNLYRDEDARYLLVEASIRGEHAGHQAAQVTFTAATWTHIDEQMDRHHPGRQIIGWYHTHPGFGIFLSGMDLFIQEHFFGRPEQVALVYDPLQHEDGVFIWRDGTPVREAYLVEADVAAASNEPASDGPVAGLAERVAALERRQRQLLAGMALVGLAVLAVLLWLLVWEPWNTPSQPDSAAEEEQRFDPDEKLRRELQRFRRLREPIEQPGPME